jgi:hypothetical protein
MAVETLTVSSSGQLWILAVQPPSPDCTIPHPAIGSLPSNAAADAEAVVDILTRRYEDEKNFEDGTSFKGLKQQLYTVQ